MQIEEVRAIDVHAHYGVCNQKGVFEMTKRFRTGDVGVVLRRAALANTQFTIVSPITAVMPRYGADPVTGNIEAAQVVNETDGLLQWVVVDPLKPETYEQAEEMLKHPKCAGIKIHPEAHGYQITEKGADIFKFAADHNAVVQSHSGEERSLPADFAKLANDYPDVTIIISHLGCGYDEDMTHQVRAIQDSKHGNLFTDTSSAKSITPNLLEWAVTEIGADRILYGTDSPLYFAPMQRARIDKAEISDEAKRLILRDNAVKMFELNALRADFFQQKIAKIAKE